MYNAGAMAGLSPILAKNMTPEEAEARKLATFLETGQMLAGTFELKEALSRILSTLDHHHGMIRGSVMLFAEDTNELRIVASHGLDEDGRGASNIKLVKESRDASPKPANQ
jgi:phosphopantetheinyl transferase (holo-ACP synthase)